MFGRYEWKLHGTEGIGSNPPIPIYECRIGKDRNGNVWLCRAKYRPTERKFMLWFDKDVETDDDGPFLRDSVVYADDYWKAMRDYHKMVLCNYENIQDKVARFIDDNKLEKI